MQGLVHYDVTEFRNGVQHWFKKGTRQMHRENGPAWVGRKHLGPVYYLNGLEMTAKQHKDAMSPKPSCAGKEVVVDGVTYVLQEKT